MGGGSPVDLDEVADELYALPPEEFIPARRAREDEAKAEGDKSLAREIGALPKPSTAAWVCNVLVRHDPDEIGGLVELGTLVREAQENLAGDQLRALDVQRRQLVAALTRQARSLAYQRGHSVSTAVATQVEETLRAAMADPEAGEALLSGRLTSPLSYSGMGLGEQRPHLRVVPPPRAQTARPPKPSARSLSAEERRRREEEEQQAAEERRRAELAEARRAAEDAEAAAEEAAEAADAERVRADELAAREEELTDRIEYLTRELARLREESSAVGADLARVERRRKAADHRRREADAALEQARARVERLSR